MEQRHRPGVATGQAPKVAESIDLFRIVVAAQQIRLGIDHPDTLVTRHNLARVLSKAHEYEAAEKEYTDVLAIQRRALARIIPRRSGPGPDSGG